MSTMSESRGHRILFDLMDRLDMGQDDVTEPTSTDFEESLISVKDSMTEHSDLDQGAAVDENTLLSDLDVKDQPRELEGDDSYGPEDDSEEALIDLVTPGVRPNEVATKALTVFEATESTLNGHGLLATATTTSSSTESSLKPNHSIADAGPSNTALQLCTTEKADLGYREIRIGEDNVIYRWAWGSVIAWNVHESSFPAWELSEHAAMSLQQAADEWNTVHPAAVRFVRVPNKFAAVFRLSYKDHDDGQGTLARSFFPRPPPGPASNASAPGAPPWHRVGPRPRPPTSFLPRWLDKQQDQQQAQKAKRLYVYPLCFTAAHVGFMYNGT